MRRVGRERVHTIKKKSIKSLKKNVKTHFYNEDSLLSLKLLKKLHDNSTTRIYIVSNDFME